MSTFLNAPTPQARRMVVHSVTRSLKVPGDNLRAVPFSGDDGFLLLWWGPLVPVKKGDTILHFLTPVGIAVEAVQGTGLFAEKPA